MISEWAVGVAIFAVLSVCVVLGYLFAAALDYAL